MYELIQHQRLESAAATLTFTGIPNIFTDLVVKVSGRSTAASAAQTMRIKFNTSDANFVVRRLLGTGSSVQSNAGSYGNEVTLINAANNTANTFTSTEIYIPNYSGSANKSFSIDTVTEDNSTTAYQAVYAGLWSQTTAISGIELYLDGGNFAAGSSATLYGINRTSAFGKPKAIGGNITYANGYWVHTFTGSGSFIPNQDLQLDYVVIAGGGGGGHGGGGAGGYVTPSVPLLAKAQTAIPVIVGAGGANSFGITVSGSNGFDSYLGTVRAIGGGRGGSVNSTDSDLVGGSGGGSGGAGGSTNGSAGTAGQGFAGGNFSYPGSNQASAGGGGAGGPGAGNSGLSSGAGGPGIISSITGTSVGRAGGGGGGQVSTNAPGPATDGGGAGSWSSTPGNNGTANTGGGGGGAGFDVAGGSGGSGVVIVRYPAA